jgi:hypothetical protein
MLPKMKTNGMKTVHERPVVFRRFEDEEFLFFLSFFNSVSYHADIPYNVLQVRNSDGISTAKLLQNFNSSVNNTHGN